MLKHCEGNKVLVKATIYGIHEGDRHPYVLKTDSHLGFNCRFTSVSEESIVGTQAQLSVMDERQRQDMKWGEQNHEPVVWMAILGEEFGELCQAVNETHADNGPVERLKGGYENMRAEAVQVAAVAISFIEALDRRYDRSEL